MMVPSFWGFLHTVPTVEPPSGARSTSRLKLRDVT